MKPFLTLVMLLVFFMSACDSGDKSGEGLPSTGNIFVNSAPAGASITLDGVFTGKLTPDTLYGLETGNHTVKLSLGGYADSLFSVSVIAGQTEEYTVALRAVPSGHIAIQSSPSGAAIYLDDANTGKTTPDSLKNISAGIHSVKLSLANYVDTTFSATVPDAGQTVSFSITMRAVPTGNIYVNSTPAGASIFLNGTNTGKMTPDTLKNVAVGNTTIKLSLTDYADSTFSASVGAGLTTNLDIAMRKLLKVPVVVQNIFNNHCVGCHSGPGAPHGQDLSESVAYTKIVNVASVEQPALKRIAPGDTTNSYLVRKIQGTSGISGVRMPADGPPYLTTAQIDSIRSWVFNGALPR